MSNDERMIRVENACMEQAIRIEALEKRTYNLPKTDAYNRLEQRIEELESKVQWCESEIGAIYSADENWQKTWGQWREKHNELCDVVDAMLTYVRPNMQADYHKAVRLARIKTSDTEAQSFTASPEQTVGIHRLMDKYNIPTLTGAESRVKWLCEKYKETQCEPQDREDETGADEIMEELREALHEGVLLENGYDVRVRGDYQDATLKITRPIIERLITENCPATSGRDVAVDHYNGLHKSFEEERQRAEKAEAERDSAQAEVAELKEQLGETQYACDGAEDERDKALAEVVRLRDLLKAMPHLGEAHEGYVQAVNEALAEGNDNG